MGRKWRCNKAAGGARAPPGSFPRCLPLRGRLCGLFRPGGIPAPPGLQSGPVAACEPGLRQWPENARTVGTQGVRGTISVQVKAVASPHFTPSRNAGRGNGFMRYPGGNEHYFPHMTWHRFLGRDIGIGMSSPDDARCPKGFVCHHRRHHGQFPAPAGFRCIPGIIIV